MAPDLLGRCSFGPPPTAAAGRLIEVEAYAGPRTRPPTPTGGRRPRGDHVRAGGPPYVYFVYGMHWCANIVTGADGTASAVLLRAGEVVDGLPQARERRPTARPGTVIWRAGRPGSRPCSG